MGGMDDDDDEVHSRRSRQGGRDRLMATRYGKTHETSRVWHRVLAHTTALAVCNRRLDRFTVTLVDAMERRPWHLARRVERCCKQCRP